MGEESDFTGRGIHARGRSTGGQLRAPHHQDTCWVCGKTGHLARECWHRYGQASSSSANLVEDTGIDFEENEAELEVAFIEFQESLDTSEKWYMDSGASRHVTGERNHLVSVTPPVGKKTVTTTDGERHAAGGSGDVNVKSDCGEIKMTNVMYVPSLKRNLVSVGSLADKEHVIVFTNRKCLVLDNARNKQVVAQGVRHRGNGLYQLGVSSRKPSFMEANSVETTTDEANSSVPVEEIKLWHKRYGHLHYKGLSHLAKKGRVKGLPNLESIKEICPECLAGRQHRAPFPRKSESRAKVPLELVHSDLVGPLPVKSLNGSRYICVFTDDYSRKSWTYFLKTKGEAYEKFRVFREMVEKETGRQIKKLRTDRGGEFLSTSFITYCERNGIRRQLTQARTPQQNGVAERRNRTLIEKSRSMVAECSLPAFLWTEVVNTANYLINRGPTRANHGKTPEQLYTKKIPDVSHLKTFGCICFVHVPQENRQKLSSKTTMGVFIGYDDASKVYRVYMPNERKIQLSRDVVFDESKIGFHHLKKPLHVQEEIVTVRGPTTSDLREREVAQIFDEQLIEVKLLRSSK